MSASPGEPSPSREFSWLTDPVAAGVFDPGTHRPSVEFHTGTWPLVGTLSDQSGRFLTDAVVANSTSMVYGLPVSPSPVRVMLNVSLSSGSKMFAERTNGSPAVPAPATSTPGPEVSTHPQPLPQQVLGIF